MERPHPPIVHLCGDQSTGVVHDTERQTSAATRSHQPRPTPARSSSRSAAANSSAVSTPCSRSHERTARSPRLVASQRSAASASAADTVRPSSAACASSASKTSTGNEMDRFTTVDMELMVRPWYDQINAEAGTSTDLDGAPPGSTSCPSRTPLSEDNRCSGLPTGRPSPSASQTHAPAPSRIRNVRLGGDDGSTDGRSVALPREINQFQIGNSVLSAGFEELVDALV